MKKIRLPSSGLLESRCLASLAVCTVSEATPDMKLSERDSECDSCVSILLSVS